MNKANECTCPSGDGSLVHPCPAHPAVEQAGGDERAVDGKPRATKCPDCGEGDLMPGDLCACGYETDPAAGYACSECDGSGDGYVGEVCRECDGSGWFVTPEQARAALAQPSGEVVVTKNESGAIVSVTRQDKEGRVLSVIAESATLTAQAEKAEVERPEVVAWQYRVTAGPQTGWSLWHPGKGEEFERSYTVERRPLMTVAQHERIVGALRFERQQMDRAFTACINERDAALARVADMKTMADNYCALLMDANAKLAEMERQEPVALANRGTHAFWMEWTEAAAGLYGPGIKLYAHPVAQAQHSVPEGFREKFKQCMELAFAEIAYYVSPEKARDPNSRARKAGALATELHAMLAAAPGKEVGHE